MISVSATSAETFNGLKIKDSSKSKGNIFLKKIVKNLGISEIQFNKCLNNESISDKILNDRIEGQKKYSIESTPTIIINEKNLKELLILKI